MPKTKDKPNKPKIAISACLLGCPCRYDGKSTYSEQVARLAEVYELIPICPEMSAGLPTPRTPIERKDGRIIDKNGKDLTDRLNKGAKKTIDFLKKEKITTIITQQRSPSCGAGKIYDGTFSGKLIEGDGCFVEMARKAGLDCRSVETLSSC